MNYDIFSLPDELIEMECNLLDLIDLFNFMKTNTNLYKICSPVYERRITNRTLNLAILLVSNGIVLNIDGEIITKNQMYIYNYIKNHRIYGEVFKGGLDIYIECHYIRASGDNSIPLAFFAYVSDVSTKISFITPPVVNLISRYEQLEKELLDSFAPPIFEPFKDISWVIFDNRMLSSFLMTFFYKKELGLIIENYFDAEGPPGAIDFNYN